MIGPRLSDKDFFEQLDYSIPELREVKLFVDKEDYLSARKAFADFARKAVDKDKFFSLPGRERNPQPDEKVLKTANDALENILTSCGTPMKFEGPVDWFANPTYNKYPEWTWQLGRHDSLRSLAIAYRMTSDQKYADCCAKLIDGFIKQAVFPYPASNANGTLCWRTLDTGIRLNAWSQVVTTFIDNPAFGDDLIVDIFKSIYEHCYLLRYHGSRFCNWLVFELLGFTFTVMAYTFFKDSKEWVDFAIDKLYQSQHCQFYHAILYVVILDYITLENLFLLLFLIFYLPYILPIF